MGPREWRTWENTYFNPSNWINIQTNRPICNRSNMKIFQILSYSHKILQIRAFQVHCILMIFLKLDGLDLDAFSIGWVEYRLLFLIVLVETQMIFQLDGLNLGCVFN